MRANKKIPAAFFFKTMIVVLSSVIILWAPIVSAQKKASESRISKEIYAKKVIIFCLHDIDGPGRYSITSQQLEEIFKLLYKYEVHSLQSWAHKVENKIPFEKRPVILTFDDGNPSVKKIVVPMLLKYGYGATLFIYINRYANHSTFYRFLQDLPASIEVGSHSLGHPDMKTVYNSDPKAFYKELYLSRKKLEYLIQKKVMSWAWPYGSYNKAMVELALKAGYSIQVSTDYSTVVYGKDDILSRFTLEKDDPVGRAKKIISENYER